jgi:hypothetical protein
MTDRVLTSLCECAQPEVLTGVKSVTYITSGKEYSEIREPKKVVLQPNGWLYVQSKTGWFKFIPPQRVLDVYGETAE